MPEDEDDERKISDNEIFYDEQIAPVLLLLAKQCEARGMAFVASVEFDPGETGSTASIPVGDAWDLSRLIYLTARSKNNIDGILMNLARMVEKSGRPHNSIALKHFGVDPDPSKRN